MGYHLIIHRDNNSIQHEYCEHFHELANYGVKDNSIIYKGEPHWKPFVVGDHVSYGKLADPGFRGSIKAERLFMKQALDRGYMLEVIDQDPSSFAQYYGVSKDFLKIKRGDFLIRNVGNLEIEVKCKTIYWKKGKPYFYFEKDDLEKHLKMQEYTRTPVVLAFYERCSKDRENPLHDKLYMMDMDYIHERIAMKEKPGPSNGQEAYCIPVAKCLKGFELIEHYKRKLGLKSPYFKKQ